MGLGGLKFNWTCGLKADVRDHMDQLTEKQWMLMVKVLRLGTTDITNLLG